MKFLAKTTAVALVFVLISLSAHARPPEITPRELALQLASDHPPVVLDVRSDDEWEAGHIPGAIHIPYEQVEARHSEVPTDRDVVVHCAVAPRARIAEKVLIAIGHPRVLHLTGGFMAWQNDGLEIEYEAAVKP